RHEDPLAEIERYRQSGAQWIVSVGMISEGTDIPRLQVCCHMSSVKTELYFRQVLGRILRVNSGINQQAWLYTFAEQNLIEFSERIEQDIPDSCMFAKIERLIEFESESQRTCLTGHGLLEEREEVNSKLVWSSAISTELNSTGSLSTLDELRLGAFKQ
ncbi:diguanylate cyclase, partial [Vibrio anguillarum]|nr:diguanylate cyclase [Vibrio anguillarum]